MQTKLRSYQNQILNELRHIPAPYFLMGTGTGKTLVSLARFEQEATKKLLIVCPKKIIGQWKTHVNRELPDLRVFTPAKKLNSDDLNIEIMRQKEKYDVLIVNYEILHKLFNLKELINNDWTIILDEGHRIRNYGTKRNRVKATEAALALGELTTKKMILTATPTQSNYGGYIDYYPQLKFLGYLDMTYDEYYNKYCVVKSMNYGTSPYPIKTIIAYRDTYQIKNILEKCARYYETSYGDFEPQHNKIELDQVPSYKKLLKEKAYETIVITNSMRKRVALKTITSGNIYGQDFEGAHYVYNDNNSKLEWLEDFLSDTNEIVTIFYQYNVELEALKQLMTKLKKRYITINGKTKDAVSLVKQDNFDVIIGQFQAMSESIDGIQLKSHIEVFLTMPESSLTYKQAIGRIDRIGQTKVPMYYYLVMKDTLDDKIYKLIEQKLDFNEDILERLVLEEE